MGEFSAHDYNAQDVLEHYCEHGYVIFNGIVEDDDVSSLGLASLRHKAELATASTRQGNWKQRRVVGNAFPPFDKNNLDSWGVQHIMNPSLDNITGEAYLSATFQQFYAQPALTSIASVLLGCTPGQMQMELFNLLIHPESHYFALGWHRDDIRPEVTKHEEQQRLATPTYGVQFNTALYEDECLFIIPTSHRRMLSDEERTANIALPPAAVQVTGNETDFDGRWDVDPPSTLQVKLRPGQTVFYSQRILHRASYTPSRKRATLHGCYGDASDPAGAAERARNVLQHGLEWMRDPVFGAALPAQLQPSKYDVGLAVKHFADRVEHQCGRTCYRWTSHTQIKRWAIRSLDRRRAELSCACRGRINAKQILCDSCYSPLTTVVS